MVDNSSIPFEYFHSYGNMSSVLPNTFDGELYVAKEKIQNHMKALSIKVSSKCLRIRLPKGLLPKSTWVLREAYDFWITKGPKERLRFLFQYRKVG